MSSKIMLNIPDDCIKTRCDKKLVYKEQAVKITFDNSDEFESNEIKIDGCVFPKHDTTVPRCDYYIKVNDSRTKIGEHYIELKGSEFSRGIEQLKSTIQMIGTEFRTVTKRCWLVLGSTIPKDYVQFKNQVEFKRKFQAELRFVRSNATLSLND